MTLRLNSTGGGYIEIDAPNTASNFSVTMPATAGEISVKGTDGSVDLGNVNIDSSGRLLVGTSTPVNGSVLGSAETRTAQFYTTVDSGNQGLGVYNVSANPYSARLELGTGKTSFAALGTNNYLGLISFVGSDGSKFVSGAMISAEADATVSADDLPTRLVFSTTAAGANSPTERMRVNANGSVWVGNSGNARSTGGSELAPAGYIYTNVNSAPAAYFNRFTNDGVVVEIRQDNATEGTISVSGTTVSYNGAHLSRWSQLANGAERIEILRGSVLSNLDEMCEWGDEDNEQLNRMQVSSVEGDPNVSGVFDTWDDDDDTYTNDFYCAMTGDFIIRIAQGTTVQRGDLLMSAGDGTAKPQDDDIIRSKTIAKVTSTNVSCTYDDGSYCVPCVLMAC